MERFGKNWRYTNEHGYCCEAQCWQRDPCPLHTWAYMRHKNQLRKIGTFVEFPDLHNWITRNPHIHENIYDDCCGYFCEIAASFLQPNFSFWLCLHIWDYLPASKIYDASKYFFTAVNRDPCEFGKQLALLIEGLESGLEFRDFREMHHMLLENSKEFHYMTQHVCTQSLNTEIWTRWLKKMDFIFKGLLWYF